MKVKLGTVQETMLIPLVIKASETQRPKARIRDKKAVEILEQLELETDKYDKFMSHEGVVARTIMFDRALKSYLQQYPDAVCVNLGCGLDSRFSRVDNGSILWYDIDLPDAIAVRKQFFQEEERVRLIEGSILEPDWTRLVKKGRKVIFIAEGILMYFTREQVKALLGGVYGLYLTGGIDAFGRGQDEQTSRYGKEYRSCLLMGDGFGKRTGTAVPGPEAYKGEQL